MGLVDSMKMPGIKLQGIEGVAAFRTGGLSGSRHPAGIYAFMFHASIASTP